MFQAVCWVGTALLEFTAKGRTEMLTKKYDKHVDCYIISLVKGTVEAKGKRQSFLLWTEEQRVGQGCQTVR